MKTFKSILPGILFVIIIALIAKMIGSQIKEIFAIETLTIAILLGMLYNNLIGTQKSLKPGATYALKKLLKVGIVLLGFKLNLQAILALGPNMIMLVLIYVPVILLSYMYLSKGFKVDKKLGTLLGVGSSICGASAVVALAPCIGADDDDAVIAVSIVSVIGAIGVIVYSAVANMDILSETQYGIWSGLTLHGVAHALAAAFAGGDISGEVGTFVKMTRVLMLVPMSLFLSYQFKGEGETKKAHFPMYVLYFIIAGIINSLNILPESLTSFFKEMSSFLILMSMTAMGLSVNFKQVANKGVKGFIMGLVLFVIASSLFLLIITLMV